MRGRRITQPVGSPLAADRPLLQLQGGFKRSVSGFGLGFSIVQGLRVLTLNGVWESSCGFMVVGIWN